MDKSYLVKNDCWLFRGL